MALSAATGVSCGRGSWFDGFGRVSGATQQRGRFGGSDSDSDSDKMGFAIMALGRVDAKTC